MNNEFNCNKTVYFQKLIIYFLLKGYVVVISFICFMTSPCNTKRLFSSFVVCVYFTWICLDMIYFILLYFSITYWKKCPICLLFIFEYYFFFITNPLYNIKRLYVKRLYRLRLRLWLVFAYDSIFKGSNPLYILLDNESGQQ